MSPTAFAVTPDQDRLNAETRDLRFHPSPVTAPRTLSKAEVDTFNREGYVRRVKLFDADEMAEHRRYFDDLVRGDGDGAAKHLEFYDEYLAVLDLTEEFYLQTIDYVFQRHLLPRGLLTHRGAPVDLGALTDVGLMTVEGERDDICAVGQTMAAHDLCTGLPPYMHAHHLQAGAGHYGVFAGKRWDQQIYPQVRNFIQAHN